MQDLADKVAFITGGVSGIGLGIAQALLTCGVRVALGHRRDIHVEEALRSLQAPPDRLRAIRVDVSDRDAMEAAAQQTERVFGKIHILCNNAGIGILSPVSKATFNDWDWAIDVNLKGVINGIHCFLPKIRAHGEGGHIVTTASMSGLVVPPNAGVYATTKFAVVGMMEALRGELHGEGIGVSVYCPGLVRTNLVDTEDSRPERYAELDRGLSEEVRQRIREQVVDYGMDPRAAGDHVLEGIRQNRLYILSHPEFEPLIRQRFEALLCALPRDVTAPASRVAAEAGTLSCATYVREIEHSITANRSQPGRSTSSTS